MTALRKNSSPVRLLLEKSGQEALASMRESLKSECIRLSPSQLVGWILARYLKASFQADRESLIQAHFDTKEYLKKVLKEIQDEKTDVAVVLNTALKRVNLSDGMGRPRRGRPRRDAGENCAAGAVADAAAEPPLATEET
jgi:hypothetical protein